MARLAAYGIIFIGIFNPLALVNGALAGRATDGAFSPDPMAPRRLHAASRVSDIGIRSLDIPIRRDIEMHYVGDAISSSDMPFVASVKVRSKLPALMLEDIEHLLRGVQCNGQSIELKFDSTRGWSKARDTLKDFPKFLLVTSHKGCNDEGSRLSYSVSRSLSLEDTSTIKLTTLPVPWKDAYESLQTDFSYGGGHLGLRSHERLQRRNISEVLDSGILARDTSETVNFSIVQKQILPSENSILKDAEGAILPAGLKVSCTQCSVAGTVELSTGSFSVSTKKNELDEIIHFIESGFAKMVAHDWSAHVEVTASYPPSTGKTFTADLANIGLTPFQIPDIATVGPTFIAQLIVGVNLATELDFGFGLELTVPDNSAVTIDFGDFSKSSITGFDQTSVNLLPFQANITDVSLTATATLQPQLILGITLFDNIGTAGAGVFLNLPQLSLQVAEVAGTNANCEPIAGSSGSLPNGKGDLLHIVPELALAGGLLAEVTAGKFGLHLDKSTAFTPLATTFTGPTACLAFQNGAFVPATAATATASATATITTTAVVVATTTAAATGTGTGAAGGIELTTFTTLVLPSRGTATLSFSTYAPVGTGVGKPSGVTASASGAVPVVAVNGTYAQPSLGLAVRG